MPGILGRHLVRVKPVPIRHGMVSTVTTSGTGFVMEVISPPAIAAEEAFGGGHHASPSRMAAVRRGALGHRCAACHAMRSIDISLLNTPSSAFCRRSHFISGRRRGRRSDPSSRDTTLLVKLRAQRRWLTERSESYCGGGVSSRDIRGIRPTLITTCLTGSIEELPDPIWIAIVYFSPVGSDTLERLRQRDARTLESTSDLTALCITPLPRPVVNNVPDGVVDLPRQKVLRPAAATSSRRHGARISTALLRDTWIQGQVSAFVSGLVQLVQVSRNVHLDDLPPTSRVLGPPLPEIVPGLFHPLRD